MNEKQRRVIIILWSVTAASLVAGFALLAAGLIPFLRSLLAPVVDLFASLGGGEYYEATPASYNSGDIVLFVVGFVLLLVGAVMYRVVRQKQKEYKDASRASVQAQILLQEMGLETPPETNRPAVHVKSAPVRTCPQCGGDIERAEYSFCPYCGQNLSRMDASLAALAVPIDVSDMQTVGADVFDLAASTDTVRRCGGCGKILQDDEKEVCSLCGHDLSDD